MQLKFRAWLALQERRTLDQRRRVELARRAKPAGEPHPSDWAPAGRSNVLYR